MKTITTIISLIICTVILCDAVPKESLVKLDVNWPAYMAQHDLIWDRVP